MTIRTSKMIVTFRRPFVLGGYDEVLPAGPYDVETDEELLQDTSFPAYRRISTLIHLHAKPGHPGRISTLTIDPHELDAALERDRAPAETSLGRDVGPKTPIGTTDPCRDRLRRFRQRGPMLLRRRRLGPNCRRGGRNQDGLAPPRVSLRSGPALLSRDSGHPR